ncbi:hypothetical protein [Pseudobacter ginsenosidimutans]|uniref:O-methyltransferase involved in polyketide biosynthesis n=1 Tax=Pseudobacter ginsenosidimutans TaxID=661488 RepID=A0A4Q7MGN5_9BACT|nr:hypothetical protein [Pseudobacter ginsenosidimutans]QEC45310.1 hypothetical protein FSB84_27790 [Pseudobacter ginsenosidimutans]RZS65579.1 O-methyltransferase involved in polyketide biosynthesis [Pseudobacter ginsenosidimutans]
MTTERNFNTISPSARVLLLMKALTDIPFARETAALILDPEAFDRLLQQQHSETFLVRVLHFENRYKTIDQSLDILHPTNVLELSSGFSCRGLAMAQYKPVVYLDTDLPESASNKKSLITDLIRIHHVHRKGKLYVHPLNAMDEVQFENALQYFPPGPITIVNEGLLVYLDDEEKRALCTTIRNILKRRGGHWITGDVYLKNPDHEPGNGKQTHEDNKWKEFLAEHNVNDNKFQTYNDAEAFFNSCGFRVVHKAATMHKTLSGLSYFTTPIRNEMVDDWLKYRQTWVLDAE